MFQNFKYIAESIGKANNVINFVLMSNFQISHASLQILHLHVRSVVLAGNVMRRPAILSSLFTLIGKKKETVEDHFNNLAVFLTFMFAE